MNCPQCKKEIDHLLHVELVKQYWKATPSEEQEEWMDFNGIDEIEFEDDLGFECPDCNKVIATEREEAYNLFKGKKQNKGED